MGRSVERPLFYMTLANRLLEGLPKQALAPLIDRRLGQLAATKYHSALSAYAADPAAFIHDCVDFPAGEHPTPYQTEVLERLPVEKRIAIRAPHSAGKTALAAWLTLWGVLTAPDVKVVTTASAWRQLTRFLWPEIHKWARRLRWARLGRGPFSQDEALDLNLKLGTTQQAFAAASNNAAFIEGAQAQRIIYIFDEAKAIPPETWDAAEGAFAGAGSDTAKEAYALAISTPGEPAGRFYDIHSHKPGYEDWWTRHVTLEEAVAAGRVSAEWAEQRKAQWGEGSAVYQNRVEGEFAASDSSTVVIPLAWVERANDRWRAWRDEGAKLGRQTALGVDVGRGGNLTVVAPRHGNIVPDLHRSQVADTMHVVGQVRLYRQGSRVVVDVVGIGAGVVDRLREVGIPVVGFNAGARTGATDRSGELNFVNLRSAGWWNLRELLDPAIGADLALPPDDRLTGDLTAPIWKVNSSGKIEVEGKDEIAKRIGRSTDDGDAVMMAFTTPEMLSEEELDALAKTTPSRFTSSVEGGRWGRGEKRGWHE